MDDPGGVGRRTRILVVGVHNSIQQRVRVMPGQMRDRGCGWRARLIRDRFYADQDAGWAGSLPGGAARRLGR